MTESKLPQDAKDYFVYVCFISSTEEVYITVWSMFNLWERGKERSHPKHCMFPTIQNFRVSFIEGSAICKILIVLGSIVTPIIANHYKLFKNWLN